MFHLNCNNLFFIFLLQYGKKFLENLKKTKGFLSTVHSQCCQKLFLEKHGCLDKKERKKRAENPNKTGKKTGFLAQISLILTHPTFFIAFLCHNIFQDSKIGNIFEETFLKKFSKAKSFENSLCEN